MRVYCVYVRVVWHLQCLLYFQIRLCALRRSGDIPTLSCCPTPLRPDQLVMIARRWVRRLGREEKWPSLNGSDLTRLKPSSLVRTCTKGCFIVHPAESSHFCPFPTTPPRSQYAVQRTLHSPLWCVVRRKRGSACLRLGCRWLW